MLSKVLKRGQATDEGKNGDMASDLSSDVEIE